MLSSLFGSTIGELQNKWREKSMSVNEKLRKAAQESRSHFLELQSNLQKK